MVTIEVRLHHVHNLEEIQRIIGRPPMRTDGKRHLFEVGMREEHHLMVIRLNALYGVQARIVEAGDAQVQAR